jgi:hypothetical protein
VLNAEAAFAVAGEIASDPHVVRALYRKMDVSRGWLYWEIGYRCDDGEEWTIETYLGGSTDPYAGWSSELAAAFDGVLTEEHRRAILELKEAMVEEPEYRAMNVYRAVVDGSVRDIDAFRCWRAEHGSAELVRWRPGTVPPA